MPRVVVHLRRRDLLRAQFQMIRRMRIFKLLFIASLIAAAWRAWHSPGPVWLDALAAVVTPLLITTAAIIITYAIVAPRLLLRLRRARGVLGEHVFEITPDGLREATDAGETRVAWGNAEKMMRTRSYLLVRIHARGFFVFPRRAFADRAAYDDFWKGLQPLVSK